MRTIVLLFIACCLLPQSYAVILKSEVPARGTLSTFGPYVTGEEMKTEISAIIDVVPLWKHGDYRFSVRGGTIFLNQPAKGLGTASTYDSLELSILPAESGPWLKGYGDGFVYYHMKAKLLTRLDEGTATMAGSGYPAWFYDFGATPEEAHMKVSLFHIRMVEDQIISAMIVFPKGNDLEQIIMSDDPFSEGGSEDFIGVGLTLSANPVTMDVLADPEPENPFDPDQLTLIQAEDGQVQENFGRKVVRSDGVIAVAVNEEQGKVYIYRTDGAVWQLEDEITPPPWNNYLVQSSEGFGTDIDLHGDVLVVGDSLYSEDGLSSTGLAHVYRHDGAGNWQWEAALGPDALLQDSALFGATVAVHNNDILVGAPGTHPGGIAYAFKFNGTNWEGNGHYLPDMATTFKDSTAFGSEVELNEAYALIGDIRTSNGIGPNAGAVYLLKRATAASAWEQVGKFYPSDNDKYHRFGKSIAIQDNLVVVGSPGPEQEKGGAAYLFEISGDSLIELGKLNASDGFAGDYYGSDVSINENHILVGSPYNDDLGQDAGAAYLYDVHDWLHSEIKIVYGEGTKYDYFGTSVFLGATSALIGIPFDDDFADASGSVLLIDLAEPPEPQPPDPVLTYLREDEGEDFEKFGSAVDVDGELAIVGAPNLPGNAPGAAYIYRFDGESWVLESILSAPDPAPGDLFGYAVSIHAGRAVVGSPLGDGNSVGSGVAYLYEYRDSEWNLAERFVRKGGQTGDNFGHSVEVLGETAYIGAPTANNTGAVCMFYRHRTTWSQFHEVQPQDTDEAILFGNSIAYGNNQLYVGAPMRSSPAGKNAGAVYVYEVYFIGLYEYAMIFPSDPRKWEFFGWSVETGPKKVLIGSPGYGAEGGSAYLFNLVYGEETYTVDYVEEARLQASDGSTGNFFGLSVALSGENVLIGAPGDDQLAVDSGAAYHYDVSDLSSIPEAKLIRASSEDYEHMGASVSLSGTKGLVGIPDDPPSLSKGTAMVVELQFDSPAFSLW